MTSFIIVSIHNIIMSLAFSARKINQWLIKVAIDDKFGTGSSPNDHLVIIECSLHINDRCNRHGRIFRETEY